MAFGGFSSQKDTQPVAEINMIPLIDVMLVLLVIFIITAPLMTHALKISLPTATSAPLPTKPDAIHISIDAQGVVSWDGDVQTREQWQQKMHEAAATPLAPNVIVRADGELAYRKIAEVLADASGAGLSRIALATQPVLAE